MGGRLLEGQQQQQRQQIRHEDTSLPSLRLLVFKEWNDATLNDHSGFEVTNGAVRTFNIAYGSLLPAMTLNMDRLVT